MARISKPPRNRAGHYRHFVVQKHLIEKHFPIFHCNLKCGKLECVGDISPTTYSTRYTVQICYTEWGIPEVRILKPEIKARSIIHMYSDGRLCLYHPPTQPWLSSNDLHKTIIPWTSEWLTYYELFLEEGKWLGPEIQHGTIN
jgi:hypothetical protein